MVRKLKLNVKAKLFLGFVLFFVVSSVALGALAIILEWMDLSVRNTEDILVLFSIIVYIIVSVIIGLVLRKWISKPMKKLLSGAEKLAQGNLDVDLKVLTGDEMESLAGSLSRMKSSLKIAFDWLGPPKKDDYVKLKKVKGLGIDDKIVIGLIAFLILNPIVNWLALKFTEGSTLGPSAVTFLFSLVLLILIISYLNKSIMEPLASLADAMEKVSKGDFKTKIEVTNAGDIGRLERNFKMISERVQKAMKELELQ